MAEDTINKEATTEDSVNLFSKIYSLQGISFTWKKINFKLYQDLELIKLEYSRIQQKVLKQNLKEDKLLVEGFKEVASEYSIEEVIELFTNKDWQNNTDKIGVFFEGNEWILDRILELSLEAETDAKEIYLLRDGVVNKLIRTCLESNDKPNTVVNTEPQSIDECRELMDFARDLFRDFFFITTSKTMK